MVAFWSPNTGFTMPTSTGQEAQYYTFSTSNTRLSCRTDREKESVKCFCLTDEEDGGWGNGERMGIEAKV